MSEPKNGLTIAEMQRVAHTNAEAKGFWEDPPKAQMEFASAVTLVHHYLSRALEADRNDLEEEKRICLRGALNSVGTLLTEGPGEVLEEGVKPSLELTKMALIHSETSEAAEPLLFGGVDNMGEELGDVVIRVGDLAGGTGVELEEEITKKMNKNASRPHMHGKAY